MVVLPFETYSVVPSIGDTARHLRSDYRGSVIASVQLAEEFGYVGTLVHYNFRGVDPWSLVPIIFDATTTLTPLIATPANAAPPHTVARQVVSAAAIHGRRVALNLIAGADPAELASINDHLDHDARYARVQQHIEIMLCLLDHAGEPTTVCGEHWRYDGFTLTPDMPAELRPEVFVAGSSPAGRAVAARVADVAVTHTIDPTATEINDFVSAARSAGLHMGMRVGILAREDPLEAWSVAEARFPADRRSTLVAAQKLRSNSHWMRSLAEQAFRPDSDSSRTWLGGFVSAKSHAAYLVGGYDEVAETLGAYRDLGFSRLLLDGPFDEPEFRHTNEVFLRLAGASDCTEGP